MKMLYVLFELGRIYKAEAYSEPCQTFKMECFAKIVKRWRPLTISAECSILDVWQISECAFAGCMKRIVHAEENWHAQIWRAMLP